MSSDLAQRLISSTKSEPSIEEKLLKLESLEKLMRGNYQLLYSNFTHIASLAESPSPAVKVWLSEFFRRAFSNPKLPYQLAPVLPRMLMIVAKFIESTDTVVSVKGLQCATGIFSSMIALMVNNPTKVTSELWQSLETLAQVGSGINVVNDCNVGLAVVKFLQVVVVALTPSKPGSKVFPPDHPVLPQNGIELGTNYFFHLVSLANLEGSSYTVTTALINTLTTLLLKRPHICHDTINLMKALYHSPPQHFKDSQRQHIFKTIRLQFLIVMRNGNSQIQELAALALCDIGSEADVRAHYKHLKQPMPQVAGSAQVPLKQEDVIQEKMKQEKEPSIRPAPEEMNAPGIKRPRKERNHIQPKLQAMVPPPPPPPRVKPVIVDPSFCPPEVIANLIIDCLSSLPQHQVDEAIKFAQQNRVFERVLADSHAKASAKASAKPLEPPFQSKNEPAPSTAPKMEVLEAIPIIEPQDTMEDVPAPELQGSTEVIKIEPQVNGVVAEASSSKFGDSTIEILSQTFKKEERVTPEIKAEAQSPRMDDPEPPQEIDDAGFQLQVPELTLQEQSFCKWEACQRILETQALYTHASGSNVYWFQVAGRLAAMEEEESLFGENKVRGRILEFILQDFASRVELASTWLYEEYLQSTTEAKEESSVYSKSLCQIIEGYTPRLPTKDIHLATFLLGLPVIPEACFPLIEVICKRPNRQPVGVSILREIADHRPPLRAICLRHVLDFCLSDDKKLRTSAIVSARKWYGESPLLASQIETFARNSLQGLTELPLDKPVQELAQLAVAHLELYFALTSITPALLRDIFTIYPQVDGAIRLVMEREIAPLVRLIGPASTALLQYLCQFPPGSEELAYRALLILIPPNRKEEHLLQRLLEAIKEEVKNESLSIRFLIPLLPFLNESEISSLLPTVLALLSNEDHQLVKDFFIKLATPWGPPPTPPPPPPAQMYGLAPPTVQPPQPAPPIMKPSKIILLLHCKDFDVLRPQVIKAICICLAEVALFPATDITEALQQMIDLNKMPVLLMRTMIEFIKIHAAGPAIVKVIPPLLLRLVHKSIWTQPTLWEGFIRVCNMIGTASHAILLKLPASELEYALSKFKGLKDALTTRVRAHLAINPSATMQMAHLLHLFTEPEEPAEPLDVDVDHNSDHSNDAPELAYGGDATAESTQQKEAARSRSNSPAPSPVAS